VGLAPLRRGGRRERHTGGAYVVAEDLAELVGGGLADEASLAAEGGDADDGVGTRAAGDLDRRPHVVVELCHRRRIDQLHAALGAAVLRQKCLVAAAYDVDDGVADADDVVLLHGAPRAMSRPL